MLSLLLVNFANEGGENTPFENLAYRGRWVSLAYYASQVLLMLGYLRVQRLGWGVSLVVVLIVAALRTLLVAGAGLGYRRFRARTRQRDQ